MARNDWPRAWKPVRQRWRGCSRRRLNDQGTAWGISHVNEVEHVAEVDWVHRAAAVESLIQAGPGVLGFALPLGLENALLGESPDGLRTAAATLTETRLRADGQIETLWVSIGYLQVLRRRAYLRLRDRCAELIASIDAALEN